eukprot:TRINITY_DN23302_c1_g1_i2.p1 TRINITY_DN23302_c1_g1~~TRINITY_DN23302_c1_g1_i2.p1  ORF type:complete len:469 (-),score=89.95 TRINITY_DN23302_c1_g1_i2:297-1703(-)
MSDDEQGPMGKITSGFCAMCVGCIALPTCLFLLATNEQRYVCAMKEIIYAQDNVVELPCSLTGMPTIPADDFGFFACPIQLSSLTEYSWCTFNGGGSGTACAAGDVFSFASSAATQTVEMVVCNEECSSKKEGKSTQESCSYSAQWTSLLMHDTFKDVTKAQSSCPGLSNFGGSNPALPLSPKTQTHYTPAPLLAGTSPTDAYKIDAQLIQQAYPSHSVPLTCASCKGNGTTPWSTNINPATLNTDGKYLYTCSPGVTSVGCIRISYESALKADESPGVLAGVSSTGDTSPQKVPASWMCSGTSKEWIKSTGSLTEKYTLEKMIDTLNLENETTTWIMRICGVMGAYIAVYCMFCPCLALVDVIGDFISYVPCIGDFIENTIESGANMIACAFACGIGCSLAFFVIGITWLVMRPFVGAIVLIGACCCCAAAGWAVQQTMGNKPKGTYKKGGQQLNEDFQDMQMDPME